jgi:hypothetical protein
MSNKKSSGGPTTRRYTESEKDQAVRLVRKLRAELGTGVTPEFRTGWLWDHATVVVSKSTGER